MIFWIGLILLIIGLIGRNAKSLPENDRNIYNACFQIGKWILIVDVLCFLLCVLFIGGLTALGIMAI